MARANDSKALRKIIDARWVYLMTEYPEQATYNGYPGQNRRWTDRSLAAVERRKKEVEKTIKALKTIKRASLSDGDQLNYDLFKRQLEEAQEAGRFPEELLPISQMWGVQNEIPQILAIMPKATVKDYEDILARMRAAPAVLDQVMKLLDVGIAKKVTYPRVAIEKVVPQIEGLLVADAAKSPLLEPFQQFPPEFTAKQKEQLTQQAAEVLKKQLIPAFTSLRDFVVKKYLPACRTQIGWDAMPDGAAWYALAVRQQTTTDLTPAQIHKIGLQEVARIRAEMEAVKNKAGFKGSLDAFNDFLRTDKQFFFARESDLVAAYRDLAKRIDPELPRLFGKLPRLTYGVLPIPEFAAPAQPTAYYQPGSPTAGRAGNFFTNTYDLKSRPNWEMEALTLHEAVPGHHLQIALAQELEGVPEFRKYDLNNAYVEGWALYAESLGADLNLYKNPYAEFGKLTYEIWRSIRLVVDTGMHTMGWSRDKAIEYFTANAGKAGHEITQEIDRYMVMPAQALGYKLGHLRILEIRKKAQAKLGAKFSIRAFHDAVLENGALPLGVLEARIDRWTAAQKKSK